jgi:glycosyltransferase involved in cell wall biosynthesis
MVRNVEKRCCGIRYNFIDRAKNLKRLPVPFWNVRLGAIQYFFPGRSPFIGEAGGMTGSCSCWLPVESLLPMPHISVVIPLYQAERFIEDTLACVLAQTFTDFEVIVVDDGSRDRGPDLVRACPDPRIRLVTQINRGLAGARNTGIREARADIVAFLDADDLWHPTKLARHADYLARHPKVGVSFSASRLVDDDAVPLGMTQRPLRETFSAADIFCRNPIGNGSAPVIRRATFDAIAFFDSSLERVCWFDESYRQSEDIECWTRIAAMTIWQFGFIDAELTDYRVNSTGLSANTELQLATWRRFRAKVKAYAPHLERAHGNRAEAYQLRYLARRAVRGSAAASPALAMMLQSLVMSPRVLIEEPARTLVTLAAALAQRALPGALRECTLVSPGRFRWTRRQPTARWIVRGPDRARARDLRRPFDAQRRLVWAGGTRQSRDPAHHDSHSRPLARAE